MRDEPVPCAFICGKCHTLLWRHVPNKQMVDFNVGQISKTGNHLNRCFKKEVPHYGEPYTIRIDLK